MYGFYIKIYNPHLSSFHGYIYQTYIPNLYVSNMILSGWAVAGRCCSPTGAHRGWPWGMALFVPNFGRILRPLRMQQTKSKQSRFQTYEISQWGGPNPLRNPDKKKNPYEMDAYEIWTHCMSICTQRYRHIYTWMPEHMFLGILAAQDSNHLLCWKIMNSPATPAAPDISRPADADGFCACHQEHLHSIDQSDWGVASCSQFPFDNHFPKATWK